MKVLAAAATSPPIYWSCLSLSFPLRAKHKLKYQSSLTHSWGMCVFQSLIFLIFEPQPCGVVVKI